MEKKLLNGTQETRRLSEIQVLYTQWKNDNHTTAEKDAPCKPPFDFLEKEGKGRLWLNHVNPL